jgi:hypothetical protein
MLCGLTTAVGRTAAVWRAARSACVFGSVHGIDFCGIHSGDSCLAAVGVPQDIGVLCHGGGRLVVGGGQVVSHGCWQFPQKQSQKERVVLVASRGQEGQHLIHQMGWPAVTEGRKVDERTLAAIVFWRSCR